MLKTLISTIGLLAASAFGLNHSQPASHAPIFPPAIHTAPTRQSLLPTPFPVVPSLSPTLSVQPPLQKGAGVVLGTSTKVVAAQPAFITAAQLQIQLEQLGNSLKELIYAQSSIQGSLPATGGYTNNLALTNRIDQLTNTTITNATVHGIAGLTASDIPSISLSAGVAGILPVANGGTGWSSFLAGYIPFGNGSGAIATSSYFFWDNTNSRLGIGTSSPTVPLEIFGANASTNLVTGGGILAALVNSDQTNGNFDSLSYRMINSAGAEVTGTRLSGVFNSHTAGSESADLAFLTRNAGVLSEKARLTGAGNLGIGTTSPFAALSVTGNAYFSGSINVGDAATTRSNLGLAYAASTDFVTIATWGDSLTYGAGGVSFPSYLSNLTGGPVYNGGVNGYTSSQIAAAMLASTDKYSWPTIIWSGRNDITGVLSTDEPTILANIASMVAALTTNYYLVLSIPNFSTEPSGSAGYNEVIQINNDLAAIYGARFWDVRAYLVSLYNSALPQDVTDHANDVTPSSLRADQVHPNDAGNLKIAQYLQAHLSSLVPDQSSHAVLTPQNLLNLLTGPYTFASLDTTLGYRQGNQLILAYSGTTRSVAIGAPDAAAAAATTSTMSNIAIGYQALKTAPVSSTAHDNVAIGARSLSNVTTGGENIAVGLQALQLNSSGSKNVAVGRGSLSTNTSGLQNVIVGYNAAQFNASATNTVAVGYRAGWGGGLSYFNQGGTYLGYQAGLSLAASSDYNTFLGYQAGTNVTSGSANIIISANVNSGGTHITTGGNNILIGYNANTPSTSQNNFLNIGGILFGTLPATSSATTFATPTTGAIGIGTSTPAWTLTISSSTAPQLALTDTTSANNAWTFRSISNSLYIATSSATATSTVSALTINPNGLFGVSTSSPWRTLSVTGTVGLQGLTGAVGAGSLCLSANKEVVYNSGSDACLSSLRATKHDITTLTLPGTTTIAALQSVSFIYNDDASSTVRYGFIAEDAAAVNIHFATHDANGNISGIDDRSIISVLVKAVQELTATVAGFADNLVSAHITVTTGDFKEVNTEKLCVNDATGATTCINKTQLDALLEGQSPTPSTTAVESAPSIVPDDASSTADATSAP